MSVWREEIAASSAAQTHKVLTHVPVTVDTCCHLMGTPAIHLKCVGDGSLQLVAVFRPQDGLTITRNKTSSVNGSLTFR